MILDDDQALIRRILKGDRSSFEQLMKQYNKRMFNFIYRMVRDEEVAVELTQDFFIKIYTVLQKYNFEYKFSTWAYRICYNLVIDHVRKHPENVDSLDHDLLSRKLLAKTDQVVREDGFSNLEKEEMRDYVWGVVERIPQKYRHLILLRYQQGLKYEEIAEVTELPVGTVKNRIFKAKELIRREIAEDGMPTQ
ncbi:MAG: sigma-70 family RNA polymerase sigma factor [Acidobacteriota bacterium]|jgi:RNA polymerase sigma-70 factor (ECF subfamily)|nr:sigma-70 family RNA polymerase sigma factor [Acidobacteriota bacterium]